MKILVIIDCQNDFISGALGTPEAEAIVPTVIEKIENGNYDIVYATMDTHNNNYLETLEGKKLPIPHCIKKSGAGWKLPNNILTAIFSKMFYQIIKKPTFGTFEIVNDIEFIADNEKEIEEIEICGLCTDICVISNALILRAAFPNTIIKCDAKACAGTSVEAHKAALKVMESCQIEVYNNED